MCQSGLVVTPHPFPNLTLNLPLKYTFKAAETGQHASKRLVGEKRGGFYGLAVGLPERHWGFGLSLTSHLCPIRHVQDR